MGHCQVFIVLLISSCLHIPGILHIGIMKMVWDHGERQDGGTEKCDFGVVHVGLTGAYLVKTEALQCFACTASLLLSKDCRSLSAARVIDCPATSTHCNAIVTDIDGNITVNRGCSGQVFSWGFGQDECDIMTNDKIIDRAVAFYQCRGDSCNNIEPGPVTTVDRTLSGVPRRVPQMLMSSQMLSEHSVSADGNTISDDGAVISNHEDDTRMAKQLLDASDDQDDDSYGRDPGRVKRKRSSPSRIQKTSRPTTTSTTSTSTSTTTTTPSTTTTASTTTVTPLGTEAIEISDVFDPDDSYGLPPSKRRTVRTTTEEPITTSLQTAMPTTMAVWTVPLTTTTSSITSTTLTTGSTSTVAPRLTYPSFRHITRFKRPKDFTVFD